MSRGIWRIRYREGQCSEFGRVRPVHLTEVDTIERRTEVREGLATMMIRLGWKAGAPTPKAGEYLSMHERYGKTLVIVDRVSRSCVCCSDRAVTFIHATDVEGVLPQARTCECVSKRIWAESAAWNSAPGDGKCRRSGANSLSQISDAIKEKTRRGA